MSVRPVRVYIDLPLNVRKRLAHAALERDVVVPIYARALVLDWLASGKTVLPIVAEPLAGRRAAPSLRIPVSKAQHLELRRASVDLDCSVSALVARIVNARCPLEAEIVAAILQG
jgi:hypothetical protein